jgi:hypothetical protein
MYDKTNVIIVRNKVKNSKGHCYKRHTKTATKTTFYIIQKDI